MIFYVVCSDEEKKTSLDPFFYPPPPPPFKAVRMFASFLSIVWTIRIFFVHVCLFDIFGFLVGNRVCYLLKGSQDQTPVCVNLFHILYPKHEQLR
jgi:hypothetical protein